jgi:hypothetical protein
VKILALAALLVLLASAAARAANPAAYRVHVNWICRGYAPAGKQLEAHMRRAQRTGDYAGWTAALASALRLDLEQDARIETVPVPATLEPKMRPILDRLGAIDAHARAALQTRQAMPAELLAIDRLARPLDVQLGDAALWDCRS